MKFTKSDLGPIIVFLVAATTVLIWFLVRKGTDIFPDYAISTHSLGQLSGLVGMTLFALTFLLTTRLKFIEDLFGGLDRVYKSHRNIGILAFISILFHPLLLVIKFVPSNFKQAAIYLLPSSSWPVNLGIIALLSMTILIILTIYINMKYPNWKFSHKFMGLVFVIAFFHVFTIASDVTSYPALWIYMFSVSLIGFSAYVYSSFLSLKLRTKLRYGVESVSLRDKITLINLKPLRQPLRFKPGQFIFIRFLGNNISSEQHPFTIASSPNSELITIAVKDLGDYTSSLKNLKPGILTEIEGPYGKFSSQDHKEKPQIWVAGGIGITPFLSMASSLSSLQKPVDLYYCVNNKKEAVFLDYLLKISGKVKGLRIITHFSEDQGKISIQRINEVSGSLQDKAFFFCGPPGLIAALKNELREKKIPEGNMISEEFDLK